MPFSNVSLERNVACCSTESRGDVSHVIGRRHINNYAVIKTLGGGSYGRVKLVEEVRSKKMYVPVHGRSFIELLLCLCLCGFAP